MRSHSRRGVTMIETVIGALLVGGVLVSTLEMVGPTVGSSLTAGEEVVAAQIADALLDEISVLPFSDPTHVTTLIGLNTGESNATRATFDDVDDYNGWSKPPQSKAGVARTGLHGVWAETVAVSHVTDSNPNSVSLTETGVKRVTVTVSKDGRTLATRRVLRTRSFDAARSAP